MRELSLRIFGTENYEDMLAILSPYDGMVRKFNKAVARLQNEGGKL